MVNDFKPLTGADRIGCPLLLQFSIRKGWQTLASQGGFLLAPFKTNFLVVCCVAACFGGVSSRAGLSHKHIHEQQRLNRLLLAAAEAGNQVKVRQLVAKGASVKAVGGMALLTLSYTGATESGYNPFSLVRYLVMRGADVNAHNEDGRTPLMVAASTNSTDTIHLLLAHKADLEARDTDGNTALIAAAYAEGEGAYCNPEAAHILLTHGARVNAKNKSGNTALMRLGQLGYGDDDDFYPKVMALARDLVAFGANIGLKNKQGKTASQIATANHMARLARFLVESSRTRRKHNKFMVRSSVIRH